MSTHTESGRLYVVATPIGNLADMSFRAIDTLKNVDLIVAEDTRHARLLLNHYAISKPLTSLHQYNEDKASIEILKKLQSGLNIALVSDAGTPLLSDPGMPLVRAARDADVTVIPIPGACALIAALSVAGLPVNRFTFEGFAPRNAGERKAFFSERVNYPCTWVFYESSHRILDSLHDLAELLPATRQIVIARELTKLHETIIKTNLSKALELVTHDENMRKGEFVVIVEAATLVENISISTEHQKLLQILLRECSTKSAASLAAEITGIRKKLLYQAALAIVDEKLTP